VPQANLSITKSDGATLVAPGATVIYTIVASNPAAVAVSGVTIADTFPAAFSSCTWTCAASAGGSCPAANGNGTINQVVTIGAAGSVTHTATCVLSPGATGTVANTATVAYANDPVPGNNTATDTDTIDPDLLFANGFE
jgi:uncharacterized repeat protein (TIGR01451 family)